MPCLSLFTRVGFPFDFEAVGEIERSLIGPADYRMKTLVKSRR